jgi:hypothetical protein
MIKISVLAESAVSKMELTLNSFLNIYLIL